VLFNTLRAVFDNCRTEVRGIKPRQFSIKRKTDPPFLTKRILKKLYSLVYIMQHTKVFKIFTPNT
ncbi:hypothetical protein COV19_00005, partial [Candidatus Woesearchaeota archaeon CG10_big_fil_rev_8_21_14_0_10_44_13]